MTNMDHAQRALHATVVREARRSRLRSALVAAGLGDPAIQPYLREVDARWPGYIDTERLRMAGVLAKNEPALA